MAALGQSYFGWVDGVRTKAVLVSTHPRADGSKFYVLAVPAEDTDERHVAPRGRVLADRPQRLCVLHPVGRRLRASLDGLLEVEDLVGDHVLRAERGPLGAWPRLSAPRGCV